MEPFLVLAGITAVGYGAVKAVKKMAQWHDYAAAQRQLRHEQQRQWNAQREHARQQYAQHNQLYARLQAGLLQLHDAPDFQRAASLAQQAREVPVTYRQQQFLRFRSALAEHFARRLHVGEDEQRLLTSLTTLVQALGMADFEAQYIVSEAEQRLAPPTRPQAVPYEVQLRRLQSDHDQRVATLRSLAGLDNDLREQLLEVEQNRFREAVLALDSRPANARANS